MEEAKESVLTYLKDTNMLNSTSDTKMSDKVNNDAYGPTPPTTSPKSPVFFGPEHPTKMKRRIVPVPITISDDDESMVISSPSVKNTSTKTSAPKTSKEKLDFNKYVCKTHQYTEDGKDIFYNLTLTDGDPTDEIWVGEHYMDRDFQLVVSEYWSNAPQDTSEPRGDAEMGENDEDDENSNTDTPSKRKSDASMDLAGLASKTFKKLKLSVRAPEAVFGWRRSPCGRYMEHEIGKMDGKGGKRWVKADDLEGGDWDERRDRYWHAHPKELVKATAKFEYYDEVGRDQVFSIRIWASYLIEKRYVKFHGNGIGARGYKRFDEETDAGRREAAVFGGDVPEHYNEAIGKWWRRVDTQLDWERIGEEIQAPLKGHLLLAPASSKPDKANPWATY